MLKAVSSCRAPARVKESSAYLRSLQQDLVYFVTYTEKVIVKEEGKEVCEDDAEGELFETTWRGQTALTKLWEHVEKTDSTALCMDECTSLDVFQNYLTPEIQDKWKQKRASIKVSALNGVKEKTAQVKPDTTSKRKSEGTDNDAKKAARLLLKLNK
eukprot:6485415-Amphidinium_carterae.1